jgi:hypothetical protein
VGSVEIDLIRLNLTKEDVGELHTVRVRRHA